MSYQIFYGYEGRRRRLNILNSGTHNTQKKRRKTNDFPTERYVNIPKL
jgi:hypothetical protein